MAVISFSNAQVTEILLAEAAIEHAAQFPLTRWQRVQQAGMQALYEDSCAALS